MTALSIFDHLALHPFAADLPAERLHHLAVYTKPVFWHPGRRIFREDAPADRFWLIRSGTVSLDFHVPGRGDVVIERLGAGEVLGWSWLLPNQRWTLGAVAVDDCRALECDARGIRAVMAEDPDLARELTDRFLLVMADRLQAARHRLIELYAYPEDPVRPHRPGHG